MLKAKGKVFISTFRISFTYTTQRNNKRNNQIEIKSSSKDIAECCFFEWVQQQNIKRPFAAYSNVKILECVEVDREIMYV